MNAPFTPKTIAPLPAPLILASSSPRRRQLLAEYGYEFSIQPADVDEIMPEEMSAADITLFNARQKALAVASKHPCAVILGVDTLVAFEGTVLGKPKDLEDAFQMLTLLSGRVHEVYSGVCLARMTPSGIVTAVEATRVKFRELHASDIRRYHARIDPLDKAGAYAAQDEHPDGVVEFIEGSKTNVIGLPMETLHSLFAKFT
jgi:septum formation protein